MIWQFSGLRRGGSLRRGHSLMSVEAVERRILLATVVNGADSGPGSLRQAILNADNLVTTGPITIDIVRGAIAETPVTTAASQPSGIAAGPDGALWFTETAAHRIGRIGVDGTITEFPVTAGSGPLAITAGPDGNLWFTEPTAGRIGRITTTGTVTEFPVFPSGGSDFSDPFGITAGPDGNLWFTDPSSNAVGMMTTTGTATEFTIPTPQSDPEAITAGPDGNLWFSETAGQKIGRITTGGVIQEFSVVGSPEGITTGPDGGLWFTESNFGTIGRISTTGGVQTFPLPSPNSGPEGIAAGPDGALWFTEPGTNQVGRITTTGVLTQYSTPTPASGLFDIAAGPDGEMWTTEQAANQIARVTTETSPTILPLSQEPALTVSGVGIDGTTQQGYAGRPIVVLSGARISSGLGAVNGLTLAGNGNTVSTVQGLVINGFTGAGIAVNTSHSVITNNQIGTDVSGTVAQSSGTGVLVQGTPSGTSAFGTPVAAGNVISGNVISGNIGVGVSLLGSSSGTVLVGNEIGTDATGTKALGNGTSGVAIAAGAVDSTIGGTQPGQGNVIAANGQSGIAVGVRGGFATIEGNAIGTDRLGTINLGNLGDGVLLGGSNNVVGDAFPGPLPPAGQPTGAANIIAYNTGAGVNVAGGIQNTILNNRIFGNANLGIRVAAGANNGQLPPVLTSVALQANGTSVQGTVRGTPNTNYVVQIYANPAPDPSGAGQGTTLVTAATTTTDANGLATFTVLATNVTAGQYLTATATDALGNTSAFAQDVLVPPSFVVTNTNDSGPGSLRQALLNANAFPGINTVTFQIPPGGPATGAIETIRLLSPLSPITDPVIIDGTSQPGYASAGHPLIEVNGAAAGAATNGLVLQTADSIVQGLAIDNFANSGILLLASQSIVIRNNVLGADATGTKALGNTDGLLIADSSNNVVLDNVLSGNTQVGIQILGNFALSGSDGGSFTADSTNNVVVGNLIGTNSGGTGRLGNGSDGVFINNASGNTVGGLGTAARNVISGNSQAGVQVFGPLARGNRIEGNEIGTAVGGLAPLGNVNIGIFINNAPGNTIGGTEPGAANVISGNFAGPLTPNPGATLENTGAGGVVILGAGSSGNQVLDNLIGTDASGTVALGNAYDGVAIAGASGNLVSGNTLSGNGVVGVRLAGAHASGNVVISNRIGTDISGRARLGNGAGGMYIVQAPGNVIGAPGAGNIIVANSGAGLVIDGTGASGNVVQSNWIGTNPTGDGGLGNTSDGVFINHASGNTVGGTGQGTGNVIANNAFSGVELVGADTTRNGVFGNLVTGNAGSGVLLQGARDNAIGGTQSGMPNTITNNGQGGITVLVGGEPTANVAATGNLVGGNQLSGNGTGSSAPSSPGTGLHHKALVSRTPVPRGHRLVRRR